MTHKIHKDGNLESRKYCAKFLKILPKEFRKHALIGIHPDDEYSVDFMSDNGMLDIAFEQDGVVTWAASINQHDSVSKGHFRLGYIIPYFVLALIVQVLFLTASYTIG